MSPTELFSRPAEKILKEGSMKPPIPSSMELHRILNQMLIHRYNLSAQFLHSSTDEVPNLPEEYSIHFSEPFEGLLVVRSTAEFERSLQSTAEVSLLDLTILFFHQLVLDSWKLDTRKLKAALFKRSVPAVWPDRNHDTGCIVLVKDTLLGIRLWAPVSGPEMERWRAFRK